jgi:hypothetical protein
MRVSQIDRVLAVFAGHSPIISVGTSNGIVYYYTFTIIYHRLYINTNILTSRCEAVLFVQKLTHLVKKSQ